MDKKIFIFMFIVLLSSFALGATEDLYINFNDNILDQTGSHDGTNNGITYSTDYPSYGVSGSGTNKSGEFINPDYVLFNPSDSRNVLEDTTGSISIWFKTDDASTIDTYGSLWSFTKLGVKDPYLWVALSDTTGYIYISIGIVAVGNYEVDVVDNVWHNLIITQDGTNGLEYYFDGSVITDDIVFSTGDESSTYWLGTFNTYTTFSIGSLYRTGIKSNDFFYNGYIDEFRYYDDALTTTEAENLYNCGTLACASSLLEITLLDVGNNTLSNFTAQIINSTTTKTLTTTNGSIFYPTGQTASIKIYDINNTGWSYNVLFNASVNTSLGGIFRTDINDTTLPTITLNPSNGFNTGNFSIVNQFKDTLPLNISFADERDLYGYYVNITKDGNIYFNYTNYSISGTSSSYVNSLNVSSWASGNYNVEIKAFDSKTHSRTNPDLEINNEQTEDYNWFRGNYSKVEPILFEFETGNLALMFTDDTTISNITGVLYFDGSNILNTSSVDTGAYWQLNNTIGNKIAGVYDYSWFVTVTQADGNSSTINITGDLELFAFGIDDCSVFNHTTLILNIFDEDAPSNKLVSSVEIDAEIWVSSPSNSRQYFSLLEGNSTYSLCLLNPNTVFYTDMYIKYTTEDGFTHRYYLVNQSLTNITRNESMFNFNHTTGISDMKITVREFDTYQYFEDVIVKLQRRYPAEGVWRTVQMDESGDFGLTFFNIKEENTDYRLLFYDRSNNLLKTTNNMKFICNTGVCELTFTISPYAQIFIAEPVQIIYSYDNTTKVISLVWQDPDASTKTVRTQFIKQTITGNAIICDITQTGAAGSLTCNVSAYTGDILLKVTTNSLNPYKEWISIAKQKLGQIIDQKEAGVWTFGIMLTAIMFGVVVGAVASIITSIIGLIIIYVLGLFNPITIAFIIIAAILGIIISVKIRN